MANQGVARVAPTWPTQRAPFLQGEPTVKRIVISTAVLALAIGGLGQAQAAPAVYKVTGGGQFLAEGQTTGAGSTIAFTGQSQGAEDAPAKGQFQLQLRDGAGAKETIHGTVSCVFVFAAQDGMPAMAVLGGQSGDEDFRIDITDDGQGNDAMDMVMVRRGAEARDGDDDGDEDTDTSLCDQEEEAADTLLGRGNVKIHKAKGGEAGGGDTSGKGGSKKPALSL